MKAFKTSIAVAAAFASLMTANTASAARYVFSFSPTGLTPIASGDIYTSDTLNAVGGYNVTGITGTLGGIFSLSLLPNPNQPGSVFANGLIFNNVVFPTGAPVDLRGIGAKAGPVFVNIWTDVGNVPTLSIFDGSIYYGPDINSFGDPSFKGTFSLTAVVEPESWALMIIGFGAVGTMLRRRSNALRPRRAG